ncbi:MAG: division plane positioning ATPase MipZ, partial [Paracoccaceae bacterium]|nr:division plane positioning ATPase MipZ [Paracoccaceae bacterium]
PASLADGENIYDKRLSLAISKLEETCNYILIDCPGSHSRLSQMAHSLANTLVTPMNDSYVDFDLLGRVDGETNKILGPSVYSEMVWHARQMRAEAGLKPIDWIVVHNRQGSQLMHNQRRIGEVLDALSKRIGFRVTNGLGERVVFRELFPKGLTLLDLRDAGVRAQLNLSNIAARQELRDLLKALKLPELVPEEA